MRIVSLSSVYPHPQEPGLGLFVRSRLVHIAERAELVVVAPVPVVDYSNPRRRWFQGLEVSSTRSDAGVPVLHPRWLFPPGGTPANILCLCTRLLPTLWRLRRRFPFDLIDAHFGYPEGVVAGLLAAAFDCPFTITLRGSEPVFARDRYRRRCLEWAIRRADAVFAVSESLRRFAIECGAEPARVRTIPNGIDSAVFHPRDRALCRAQFGMRPDHRVVVCAGELIEAKGHHLVIQAVRDLLAEGLPVEMYLAGGVARGGAPFDQEIERRITEWNLGANVHLAGWVKPERLAELVCAADLFCLASFTEGWPNVVNEALACGTPVVATRVGAVPEMLSSEAYGLIVPPRDQDALTAALRRALFALWDRNAVAARGLSRSWQDVAGEVTTEMQAVITHPKRRPAMLEVRRTSSMGDGA